jgi:5-methylcytosine-specific restriction endonuclease McrA
MENKALSSWIRQARYRASKKDIENDLNIEDVKQILISCDHKCAYCDETQPCWGTPAEALDHPFPLSKSTPNVPANVLPVCKSIKKEKKHTDLAYMFIMGLITQQTYLNCLKVMFANRGSEHIKDHVKKITGL